jgi:hypothetical protein
MADTLNFDIEYDLWMEIKNKLDDELYDYWKTNIHE